MNFERIATGLDVGPLLAALEAQPERWREITVRQDYPGSAHHDTEAIFLRGPRAFTVADYMGDPVAYDYPAMDALADVLVPLLRPLLQAMEVSELGYVLAVNLKPGGRIDEHVDEGAYAEHYARFHLVLTSEPGNTFTVGGESVHMAPGELWWFNHRAPHRVANDSAAGRIHVIFDAVSPHYPVHVPD